MNECTLYKIECPYALSDDAPIPCVGSSAQCQARRKEVKDGKHVIILRWSSRQADSDATYYFDTAEELNAFMTGVNESEALGDHTILKDSRES